MVGSSAWVRGGVSEVYLCGKETLVCTRSWVRSPKPTKQNPQRQLIWAVGRVLLCANTIQCSCQRYIWLRTFTHCVACIFIFFNNTYWVELFDFYEVHFVKYIIFGYFISCLEIPPQILHEYSPLFPARCLTVIKYVESSQIIFHIWHTLCTYVCICMWGACMHVCGCVSTHACVHMCVWFVHQCLWKGHPFL